MELIEIDNLMSAHGYPIPIGAIFPNWELVKDEVLLPSRKNGSGNGTVHIYLLEDNLKMLKECFSAYFQSHTQSTPCSELVCPKIEHFVQTCNLITLADFAYRYYNYDSQIFNYNDYINKVLFLDDNGFVSFSSIFKLSSENRPYFKQFDKESFGRIVRYVFISQVTAYKLYLYSDSAKQNYAVFWMLGMKAKCPYLVTEKDTTASHSNERLSIPKEENPSPLISAGTSTKYYDIVSEVSMNYGYANSEQRKQAFINYMHSQGKAGRTTTGYIRSLSVLLPNVLTEVYGTSHPSIFEISDMEILKGIDYKLFNDEPMIEHNHKWHRSLSAALHTYIRMLGKNSLVLSNSSNENKPRVAESTNDFHCAPVLCKDEEVRRYAYEKFLEERGTLSEKSRKVYRSTIQGRLTNLIRSSFDDSITNIFAISDYRRLLELDENIWNLPEFVNQNVSSLRQMKAAFQSYIDFIESQLSDDELASLAFGD